MSTENSELSFTEADTNLMREWFDAVHDLNPDYLEGKDFTLAKKLYSESELRTPNEVLEKANDTEEATASSFRVDALVSLRKEATEICKEIREQGIIEGAINWADLKCVRAEKAVMDTGDEYYRVYIEEAAPENFMLHAAIRNRLFMRTGLKVTVTTEW